jgi:predicted ATPase
MGASQMWLSLIIETVVEMPQPKAALALVENEHLYKEVNAIITALWENNGRHAFLHHLNALFEYKPIGYYEKLMLTF